ncbi:hypothetical protein RJZ90_004985 [Blastomyces dermatitidis]
MELIPDNFSSWVAEARKNNALHLKDSGWKSASKFDRPSYLSLRTVWKTKYQSNFSPKNWGITQTTRARKLLENISGWPLYLDHKDTRREGDCSVSVLEQELRRLDIQREQETTPESPIDRMSPTSPISSELANGLYPPVIDEQIVNTALIIFLNAISIECYVLFSRVLVSQDHMEIYLTIAEYDNGYVKYLRGENDEKDEISLMKMNQFGPWLLKFLASL